MFIFCKCALQKYKSKPLISKNPCRGLYGKKNLILKKSTRMKKLFVGAAIIVAGLVSAKENTAIKNQNNKTLMVSNIENSNLGRIKTLVGNLQDLNDNTSIKSINDLDSQQLSSINELTQIVKDNKQLVEESGVDCKAVGQAVRSLLTYFGVTNSTVLSIVEIAVTVACWVASVF